MIVTDMTSGQTDGDWQTDGMCASVTREKHRKQCILQWNVLNCY